MIKKKTNNINPADYKGAFKWNFEGYPLFASIWQKIAEPKKKKYYTALNKLAQNFNDGNLTMFTPSGQLLKDGRMIINEILNGNASYYNEILSVHNKVKKTIDFELLLLKGDKDKIHKNFTNLWPKLQNVNSDISYVLFNFDWSFDYFLQDLKKSTPREYEALLINSESGHRSFMLEAEKYLLELDRTYKKDFNKIHDLFLKKYFWSYNTYKGIFSIKKNWLKKYLDDIKVNNKKNKKKLKLSKTPLPPKYKLLSDLIKEISVFRDNKKKINLLTFHVIELWAKAVCLENGWDFEDIKWLCVGELIDLMDGNKKLLASAKKYRKNKNRIGFMKSDALEDFDYKTWQKIEKFYYHSEKEIKGVPASSGKVKGTAKIVLDARSNVIFKKGEILVASMTRPEFLPLMQKALAFVTDEGGISCHAAIVSRELGKPCIIGTRVATKIIKDGDFIEVDANKGIVRILKKEI
jgi:phosphoenolpyruvate synthase/pyruvate phosphate dikinase